MCHCQNCDTLGRSLCELAARSNSTVPEFVTRCIAATVQYSTAQYSIVQYSTVQFVTRCISAIEEWDRGRGLETEGLYRLPGRLR